MDAQPTSTETQTIRDALADLCAELLPDRVNLDGWEAVPAKALPAPFDRLLVHEDHMTDRLGGFHEKAVRLDVLRTHRSGDFYRRQIVLTLAGTDRIVECGIVRIHLGWMPEAVRAAILEETTPLGDILVEADVMRRIEPRWYLRFAASCPLLESFRRHPVVEMMGPPPDGSAADEIFGRIGSIHCNGEEAIELLEIVVP